MALGGRETGRLTYGGGQLNYVDLGGGNHIAAEVELKPGKNPNSANYKTDFDVIGYVSYEMPADGIWDGLSVDGLKRIERTKEEYEAQ